MIETPPENIVYFYSEHQETFTEIKQLVPSIDLKSGIPPEIFDSINPSVRNLYIFCDFMGDRDDIISTMFTKK